MAVTSIPSATAITTSAAVGDAKGSGDQKSFAAFLDQAKLSSTGQNLAFDYYRAFTAGQPVAEAGQMIFHMKGPFKSATNNKVKNFVNAQWQQFFKTAGVPPNATGRQLQQFMDVHNWSPRTKNAFAVTMGVATGLLAANRAYNNAKNTIAANGTFWDEMGRKGMQAEYMYGAALGGFVTGAGLGNVIAGSAPRDLTNRFELGIYTVLNGLSIYGFTMAPHYEAKFNAIINAVKSMDIGKYFTHTAKVWNLVVDPNEENRAITELYAESAVNSSSGQTEATKIELRKLLGSQRLLDDLVASVQPPLLRDLSQFTSALVARNPRLPPIGD